MKAWMLEKIGQFSLLEVEKPKLSFGDVQIEVKAAGICGSDVPRTYVNGAHKMPLILGHEFAGKVVCAPGPKSHWLNKRVGVFPLIPCMKCSSCQKRQYEMCSSYDYLGSRSNGGFAEYVNVPGMNLIELPEQVSYEAAAMLEPMAVAVHAIRKAEISGLDNIVIAGLGTIGLGIAMFLKDIVGTERIYLIGNKEFQKQKAVEIGIEENHYIDIKDPEWKEKLTKQLPEGSDVYFECVGKEETLLWGIELAAPLGRIITVGNPHGDMSMPRDIYWKILRKQLTVRGTWNSSFLRSADDDWHYALDAMAKGKVKPESLITHKMDMDNLLTGLELMKNKTEDYIKVMMVRE